MYTMLYSILIWGSACDSHIGTTQVLQKRVVRLMSYDDQFPLIPGPLPASFQVSMFIHKCLYLRTSDNFNEWFILNHSKHNYLTRHNYNNPSNKVATNSLFIPLARTTNYGLKMLKVKGPKIWNSLPIVIRTTKSPYCFKKLLKLHLLSLY